MLGEFSTGVIAIDASGRDAGEMTLAEVLTRQGFVIVGEHPQLRSAVQRAHRAESVRRVLPGVWIPADHEPPGLEVVAAAATGAGLTVSGWAAAALVLGMPRRSWPVTAATPRRRMGSRWLAPVVRQVPAELVMDLGGVRCTSAALTAVDLAAEDDGEAIDTALRLGLVTLDQLWEAFSSCGIRHGDLVRRQVLRASRDQPWSPAERQAHQLLRHARIKGWQANGMIRAGGWLWFGDIVFRGSRLVLEIDGFAHHASREAFQADRARQNALVLANWRVLRFTWADLTERPAEFIEATRVGLRSPSVDLSESFRSAA